MTQNILFILVVTLVAGAILVPITIRFRKSVLPLLISGIVFFGAETAIASFFIGKYGFFHLTWAIPLTVAVAAICLFLFNRKIVRVIKQFDQFISTLSEGEGDLTSRVKHSSNTEFGNMAQNFNSFLFFMSKMVGQIHTTTDELNHSLNLLQSHMEETSAAIVEIEEHINNNSKQMNHQNGAVNSSKSELGSISDHLSNLDALVQEQSSAVHESSTAIEQMIKTFLEIDEKTDSIVSAFKNLSKISTRGRQLQVDVNKRITQITNDSWKLTEANSIIEDISGQTNLLAMNAAIEAAHAGDSGKGFAVVADEIRKLAENSAGQSKSINTTLKQIIKEIEDVQTMAVNAGASFDEVNSFVQELNSTISELNTALSEQTSGTKEIFTSLSDIRNITESVKSKTSNIGGISVNLLDSMNALTNMSSQLDLSMVEISTGINEISQSSTLLSSNSMENREKITSLKNLVQKFTV